MNKKGQGISMTYIVIAALALVVLIVIILFFTGALERMFTQQRDVVDDQAQQFGIWRSQCKLYASLDQKESWEKHEFGDRPYKCSDSELIGQKWEEYKKNKKKKEESPDVSGIVNPGE
jgi:hypothetical protein